MKSWAWLPVGGADNPLGTTNRTPRPAGRWLLLPKCAFDFDTLYIFKAPPCTECNRNTEGSRRGNAAPACKDKAC